VQPALSTPEVPCAFAELGAGMSYRDMYGGIAMTMSPENRSAACLEPVEGSPCFAYAI